MAGAAGGDRDINSNLCDDASTATAESGAEAAPQTNEKNQQQQAAESRVARKADQKREVAPSWVKIECAWVRKTQERDENVRAREAQEHDESVRAGMAQEHNTGAQRTGQAEMAETQELHVSTGSTGTPDSSKAGGHSSTGDATASKVEPSAAADSSAPTERHLSNSELQAATVMKRGLILDGKAAVKAHNQLNRVTRLAVIAGHEQEITSQIGERHREAVGAGFLHAYSASTPIP